MTRNEFIISTINPLQPSAGLAQYNTTQLSKITINNGIAALRNIPQGATPDKPLYIGPLGTPVVTDITILAGTYTGYDNKQRQYEETSLITASFHISQQKKIVRSEIVGNTGIVTHEITPGPLMVMIEGVIDGANGVYPLAEVTKLRDALNSGRPLSVVSSELQPLNINYLTILDYSLPEMQGGYSSQPYRFTSVSVTPKNLNL
ncbi:MAG: hypothetical protein EOP56_18100 [Sphingobacteriales bacterium]|nr:MAG: hypothetical protein EOP56_18100 [Sphingobacteriales bacterium]